MENLAAKTKSAEESAPISREKAERAYRLVGGLLIFSIVWVVGLAVATALLEFSGWPILAGIAALDCVFAPFYMRYYRRDLDARVRQSEEALGKLVDPPAGRS